MKKLMLQRDLDVAAPLARWLYTSVRYKMADVEQFFNSELKKQFEADGFIVLSDFLSADEIEKIRQVSKAHLQSKAVFVDGGATQMDAFRHVPGLRWLVTDPRVLATFRYFCCDPLEYCHHSDVHMNKFTGWHKDNHGHNDWEARAEGSQFGIYKIAFYLQDHRNGPTALYVRKGSHRTRDNGVGEIIELRPKLGDAVLFDIRISHKGEENSIFGKAFRKLPLPGSLITSVFQMVRRLTGKREKMSIFFTFGRPNAFTAEHIDITVDRQLKQAGEHEYKLPPELEQQLTQAGVVARSVQRGAKALTT